MSETELSLTPAQLAELRLRLGKLREGEEVWSSPFANLYPAQQAAIYCNARYGLVEASTKSGKTLGCLRWLLDQARAGKSGQNFWWVAPVFGQADIGYRRMKEALPRARFVANEAKLFVRLENGAVVWFKSGEKADNLYGEDVYAAVIDEATRLREESWHAVRSTLTATRGPIRIIGNVRGRKNWAYRMARRAEAGEADMHYAKITAWDAIKAGVLTEEEVEDARRQLPASVFHELYEAEPSDDEGNPFGIDAIRACKGELSAEQPAVWGIDLAKSTDWTVAIALDRDGKVCRFERWQGPWEMTIARIGALVGGTKALVDSTGVGDPVLEALQKLGGRYEGYKFTAQSKQQLMEGLAIAIQQRAVRFPDGPIVAELEAFSFVYSRTGVSYGAPEGMHDDCVCALALAWHGWSSAAIPAWWLAPPRTPTEPELIERLLQGRASDLFD